MSHRSHTPPHPLSTAEPRSAAEPRSSAEHGGQRNASDCKVLADGELMKRIAAKDRAAFEVLYRRYYPRLAAFVGRYCKSPELVEEVIDDVLFVVWTDAGKFEGRSRASTWIFGIAHRQALGRLRRMPDEAPLEEVPEPWAEDPELRRFELRSSMRDALGALSADQRIVLELTFFEGHSYPEIAEILDCPVNTVKTRMFYARRRLRQLLPASGLFGAPSTPDEGGRRDAR